MSFFSFFLCLIVWVEDLVCCGILMEDEIFYPFYVQMNQYTKFHANGYEFFLLNFGGNRYPPATPCRKSATEDGLIIVTYDMHKSYKKNEVNENDPEISVAASRTITLLYIFIHYLTVL